VLLKSSGAGSSRLRTGTGPSAVVGGARAKAGRSDTRLIHTGHPHPAPLQLGPAGHSARQVTNAPVQEGAVGPVPHAPRSPSPSSSRLASPRLAASIRPGNPRKERERRERVALIHRRIESRIEPPPPPTSYRNRNPASPSPFLPVPSRPISPSSNLHVCVIRTVYHRLFLFHSLSATPAAAATTASSSDIRLRLHPRFLFLFYLGG
jgi:hypothetical protein